MIQTYRKLHIWNGIDLLGESISYLMQYGKVIDNILHEFNNEDHWK